MNDPWFFFDFSCSVVRHQGNELKKWQHNLASGFPSPLYHPFLKKENTECHDSMPPPNFFPVSFVLSEKVGLTKVEKSSFQFLWPLLRTAHLEIKRSHEVDPSRCSVVQRSRLTSTCFRAWPTSPRFAFTLYLTRLRRRCHRWTLAPEFVVILPRSGWNQHPRKKCVWQSRKCCTRINSEKVEECITSGHSRSIFLW
jgi:hypothetical protein